MKKSKNNGLFDKFAGVSPFFDSSGLNNIFFYRAVDEFDRPVERGKLEYPYSYDGFMIWRGGKNEEANGTIYSDRLLQWDYDRYNILSKKHFGNQGQVWYDRSPEKIEAFLRDWCESPNLRLIFVMEYCNVATGYPVWRFDYYSPLNLDK